MNRIAGVLTIEPNMKTNQTHPLRNMRNVVATVRTIVEREFSLLLEQQPRLLRLALNEAEALAWETGIPHLVFPTLAMEKIQSVAAWHARQKFVPQSQSSFALAA